MQPPHVHLTHLAQHPLGVLVCPCDHDRNALLVILLPVAVEVLADVVPVIGLTSFTAAACASNEMVEEYTWQRAYTQYAVLTTLAPWQGSCLTQQLPVKRQCLRRRHRLPTLPEIHKAGWYLVEQIAPASRMLLGWAAKCKAMAEELRIAADCSSDALPSIICPPVDAAGGP